jgi:hypothetical protein
VNKLTLLALLGGVIIAGGAGAQTVDHGSDALVGCYDRAATELGLATCEPPSALVQKVFAKCSPAEESFRKEKLEYFSNNKQAVDIYITMIHAVVPPGIQRMVAEARVKADKICPK